MKCSTPYAGVHQHREFNDDVNNVSAFLVRVLRRTARATCLVAMERAGGAGRPNFVPTNAGDEPLLRRMPVARLGKDGFTCSLVGRHGPAGRAAATGGRNPLSPRIRGVDSCFRYARFNR